MPSGGRLAIANSRSTKRSTMTKHVPISRRSMLGLAAAAVTAPVAAAEWPRAVPMHLDAVPAWRGPGLYEVAYAGGRRIFIIEQAPAPPGRPGIWFQASESLADRADGGAWSMPAESLAFQDIRKVGEIAA